MVLAFILRKLAFSSVREENSSGSTPELRLALRLRCWLLMLGVLVLAGCGATQSNPTAPSQNSGPSTVTAPAAVSSDLAGKVLVGYQGWFRGAADGSGFNNRWMYWSLDGAVPAVSDLNVDMYPDLTEYPADALYAPGTLTLKGTPAKLYSNWSPSVVDLHIKWMHDYGIDGLLVQRHVLIMNSDRNAGDIELKAIAASAAKYGVYFAIEYDTTDMDPATVASALESDWTYLSSQLRIQNQPTYLTYKGKPLVSVWGIGFNDSRSAISDPTVGASIINWFHNVGGVSLMGGVDGGWRTLDQDASPDPRWPDVYKTLDVVQPWSVGRYSSIAEFKAWNTKRIQQDLAQTSANGQFCLPVIFPGFSWYNKGRGPFNEIPRQGGQFLWQQAYGMRASGAKSLKIAMFDETNEATAIFKVAPTRDAAPDQGTWLTLDADGYSLPNDWYLRLSYEIAKGFHGNATIPAQMPANPGP